MGTDITSVKHDDFTKNTKLEMLHTLMAINDIITLSDNRDDIEAACCRHGINTDRLYALFLPEEHQKGKPAARFAKRTGTASRNDSPAEAFYLDVFNELPSDEVLVGMPTDAYDTMVYILEHPGEFSLSDREAMALYERYIDAKTYREIGKEIGSVSPERVRQIIVRSLRKLRYPRRKRVLCFGLEFYGSYRQALLQMKQEEVDSQIAKQREMIYSAKAVDTSHKPETDTANSVPQDIRKIAIDDLDLNSRSRHWLQLAGFQNLGDLLDASFDDLFRIRNIGSKSMGNIISAVRKYVPGWTPVRKQGS